MSETHQDDSVTSTLEAAAEQYPLASNYTRYIAAMIAGLDLLKVSLPPVADAALREADRYWHGDSAAAKLAESKVAIWKYIDGSALSASTEAACRAVLCVIEPQPPTDDGYDLLTWYVSFMRDAGVNEQELLPLVRSHMSTV
jgi:hypothetical protein